MGVWGKEKETFTKVSFSFPQPPEAFLPFRYDSRVLKSS